MTETAQTVKDIMEVTGTGIKDAVTAIMPYLEKVADQMGTTAQYLWSLQIKQGKILAATITIEWIVLVLLVFFLTKLAIKFMKDEDCCRNGLDVVGFFLMIGCLVGWVTCVALFFKHLGLVLTLIFNTDYWAIQQVIELIKGNIKF